MTPQGLAKLERMAFEKLLVCMKTEVMPTSFEIVNSCCRVLEFCRDTRALSVPEMPISTVTAESVQWQIMPKMRVKCISDRFHSPDGPDTRIGMTGIVYPSSMSGDKILWHVLFENGHIWDRCSEEYIRESFEPYEHEPNE